MLPLTLLLEIKMGDVLRLRGELKGHGGWVTAIATTAEDPNLLLTASRDKVKTLLDFGGFCNSFCSLSLSGI